MFTSLLSLIDETLGTSYKDRILFLCRYRDVQTRGYLRCQTFLIAGYPQHAYIGCMLDEFPLKETHTARWQGSRSIFLPGSSLWLALISTLWKVKIRNHGTTGAPLQNRPSPLTELCMACHSLVVVSTPIPAGVLLVFPCLSPCS